MNRIDSAFADERPKLTIARDARSSEKARIDCLASLR